MIKDEVQTLRIFVNEVLSSGNMSHRLILIHPNKNLTDSESIGVVKTFLKQQLHLHKIAEKVKTASLLQDGNIMFDADSTLDKKMILLKAKKLPKSFQNLQVLDAQTVDQIAGT